VTQLVTVTEWLSACKSYTVLTAVSELVRYKPSTDVCFWFWGSSRLPEQRAGSYESHSTWQCEIFVLKSLLFYSA